MNSFRRLFAAILAGTAIAGSGAASAGDGATLRLVVPVPAGGSLDTTGRLLAQQLQARGTDVVILNRPGANTMIGAAAVARAPADGNTLLYGSTTLAIAPLLQQGATSAESLVPVIQLSNETFALAVKQDGGARSIDELSLLAAGRRGIDCIAVPGVPEIACAQLNAHLRGGVTTIPYAGLAPAMTALVGGHGDVMFSPLVSLLPMVQSGQLRVLAVSSHGQADSGARVPLLSEAWKGFELEGFTGIFAPQGTPEARIEQLNREIDEILRDPGFRVTMRANGQEPVGGKPKVLALQLARTRARYGDMIRRLGLANPH